LGSRVFSVRWGGITDVLWLFLAERRATTFDARHGVRSRGDDWGIVFGMMFMAAPVSFTGTIKQYIVESIIPIAAEPYQ
jgi:hypothetical protein